MRISRLALIFGYFAFAGSAFCLPFIGSVQFSETTNLVVAAPYPSAIDNPPFTTPRGTGFDGVAVLAAWRTDLAAGYVALCTGANVGNGWILTAAHCLADISGNNVTTRFTATFFPDGSTSPETFSVGDGATILFQAHIDPLYDGATISDYDLALVNMGVAGFGAGIDTYSIYTGLHYTSALFDFVGFGQTGSGSTGATGAAGFALTNRHQGWNTFDGFYSDAVLLSDFDNGLATNDASCVTFGWCDLGLGSIESSVGHGDSGGPVFIAPGIIGAVTSFGARTSSPPDIDGTLNSSFGEFAGYVALGPNAAFIEQLLVPEPGTYALLGLGLVAVLCPRLSKP